MKSDAVLESPVAGHGRFLPLTIGAVGVVYGDIGTSPLYALREALRTAAEDGVTRGEVLGVVSLLLWALILIVTIKYVLVLLMADNRGEGGVLSLLALVQSKTGRRTGLLLALGILGAALFFGDAIITPAISVLSAVEGLKLVTPVFEPYVLPIALGLLAGLFLVQQSGTGAIARFFGPITALWFAAMAVAGAIHIADDPGVLAAFNPWYGLVFLAEHGLVGVLVLGAVFLAVTGAEALYADLGHFGRRPIQAAWFGLVFPALALNYLGQGALVLSDPATLENPFYLLVPEWALLPLVILATAATLIASQAVITGAFSLTRQAIQLGLLPRLDIRHTSEFLTGQIYMPLINMLLFLGVVALVLIFGDSSRLAAAYGIAVSGTMIVTTVLGFMYAREVRGWPLGIALLLVTPIAAIELGFFVANGLKFFQGGYVPLLLGGVVALVMATWSRGTHFLFERAKRQVVPLEAFIASIEARKPVTIPGTAVFLTSDPESTPPALLHNLKHNHVLHAQVVILTVATLEMPRVSEADRITIERLNDRFVRLTLRFGYMETPNVTKALGICRKQGLRFDVMSTTFFLTRRKLVAEGRYGMPMWQDRVFIALAGAAADPSDFYHLPRERVVELGSQLAL